MTLAETQTAIEEARTRGSTADAGRHRSGSNAGAEHYHEEERVKMKRVIVDHFGGPEVLRVVEEDAPRPGVGEVAVRVLAAGVSFTDAQLRAGTYLGVPKPPFTPGYELVGVVEELGPGCARLHVGDRIGALTVWGADAERVCVPEASGVEVPEDLDPAEVVSLVFTYMTAYQLLHRTARVKRDETVLVHGAAGRVGTAVLELGAASGLRLYGTCSARDRAAVERLGAVAIDYRTEDFLARARALPGKGVDVVLDGLGGKTSLRSFRALRPGGRLVVYGHSATISHGHRSWRGWIEWYATTAAVALWGVLSPRRRVSAYRIQKLREGHQVLPMGSRRPLPVGGGPRNPAWFREDFRALLDLLREGKIHPVVAERLPLAEARRAHELLERAASVGKLVLVP
jgi:NADPH:quinone reductase-like Zn-dependent oxidoreductase